MFRGKIGGGKSDLGLLACLSRCFAGISQCLDEDARKVGTMEADGRNFHPTIGVTSVSTVGMGGTEEDFVPTKRDASPREFGKRSIG
jgi:hypothetical protein